MAKDIRQAKEKIAGADAILIGASNGLSIAEGYNIFADNDMFRSQFGDFQANYGLRNVLDGVFSQSMSAEGRKAFMERLVKLWVTDYKPSGILKDLRTLVGDKPYFVLTTNADEHLEAAGFEADKVWEMEGTFRDSLNNRQPKDKRDSLNEFISAYTGKRLAILELGIGSRNRMIKLPLMQLTMREPQATYITLNLPHEIFVPGEIADKSIALPGDLGYTLKELA